MRFICFLILIFSTSLFASERELPVGTFPGISFSLDKNGVSIFSNEDVHYHKSTLQIKKISGHIYEFVIAVYLQDTPKSKALSETRVDRYKVIWKSDSMGALINEKIEYKRDISEFLLSNDTLIIKSQIADNGVIETQSYTISQ